MIAILLYSRHIEVIQSDKKIIGTHRITGPVEGGPHATLNGVRSLFARSELWSFYSFTPFNPILALSEFAH